MVTAARAGTKRPRMCPFYYASFCAYTSMECLDILAGFDLAWMTIFPLHCPCRSLRLQTEGRRGRQAAHSRLGGLHIASRRPCFHIAPSCVCCCASLPIVCAYFLQPPPPPPPKQASGVLRRSAESCWGFFFPGGEGSMPFLPQAIASSRISQLCGFPINRSILPFSLYRDVLFGLLRISRQLISSNIVCLLRNDRNAVSPPS